MCRILLLLIISIVTISLAEHSAGWNKKEHGWLKEGKGYEQDKGGKDKGGRCSDQGDGGRGRVDNKPDNNSGGGNNLSPTREEEDISNNPEVAFKTLARKTIADDKNTLQYCKKHTHSGASEIYGNTGYKLIIPLTDTDPDNIEVKIRHRVIFTKGETPLIDSRWNADGDNKWQDIRTLPLFLDTKKATWDVINGRLEVNIPYKFILNREVKKSCDVDYNIDEQEIIVPQGKDGNGGMLDPDLIDLIFN